MIATTTKPIPFTPAWREGDPAAPVFLLAPAGVVERSLMEAELAGRYNAGRVYSFELLAAIRSGVVALLDGDEAQGRILELIDIEQESGEAELTPADVALLAEVRKILAASWPEYRDLREQMERRRELAPIVALRHFCTGIAAPGVTFKRGLDGKVSEATLQQLEPLEMTAAGNRAFQLAYLTEEDRGNSARPSSSDDGQPTSGSDAPSTAAGSSTDDAGAKTPG